jgi:hypothetical protein
MISLQCIHSTPLEFPILLELINFLHMQRQKTVEEEGGEAAMQRCRCYLALSSFVPEVLIYHPLLNPRYKKFKPRFSSHGIRKK